jgi:hypothetical protein
MTSDGSFRGASFRVCDAVTAGQDHPPRWSRARLWSTRLWPIGRLCPMRRSGSAIEGGHETRPGGRSMRRHAGIRATFCARTEAERAHRPLRRRPQSAAGAHFVRTAGSRDTREKRPSVLQPKGPACARRTRTHQNHSRRSTLRGQAESHKEVSPAMTTEPQQRGSHPAVRVSRLGRFAIFRPQARPVETRSGSSPVSQSRARHPKAGPRLRSAAGTQRRGRRGRDGASSLCAKIKGSMVRGSGFYLRSLTLGAQSGSLHQRR